MQEECFLGLFKSLFLASVRTEEAFNILINNLNDTNVKGEVIEALGKFGDLRAIVFLEDVMMQ